MEDKIRKAIKEQIKKLKEGFRDPEDNYGMSEKPEYFDAFLYFEDLAEKKGIPLKKIRDVKMVNKYILVTWGIYQTDFSTIPAITVFHLKAAYVIIINVVNFKVLLKNWLNKLLLINKFNNVLSNNKKIIVSEYILVIFGI